MNYFEILGVSVDSTDEEVRNKYKQKLIKFHPDNNINADIGDKTFYEMMTRNITEAYEHLKIAEKRKAYYIQLHHMPNQSSDTANNTTTDVNKFIEIYKYIEERANTNSLIQGVSGIVGFPWNLMADAGTIFTHYVPMVNAIRDCFGYKRFQKDIIQPLIMGIIEDLMFDILGDKVLGSIPILGIYFNYRGAKIMTWRIGILFAFVNAQGSTYNEYILKETAKLVRHNFPSEILLSSGQEKQRRFIHIITDIYKNHAE